MRVYPARFVGEFGEIDYSDWKSTVPNVGDVALILRQREKDAPAVPHALIRCACGDLDVIPLLPATSTGWMLASREPVTIAPSVRVSVGATTTCHYFVQADQIQMLDDTTRRLP